MSDDEDDEDVMSDEDEDGELCDTLKDLIEEAVLDSAENDDEGYNRLQQLVMLGEGYEYGYDGPPLAANSDCCHCGLLIAAANGLVKACHLFWLYLSSTEQQCYTTPSEHGPDTLHTAVKNGHLDVVQFLVEELEFDVNHFDNEGNTPLVYAAARHVNDTDMARLLLENGANPNLGGRIDLMPLASLGPLYFAVDTNHTNLVRLLLQYHADPNFNNRRPAPEEEQRVNTESAEYAAIQPPAWRSYHYWDQLKSPRNTDVAIYHGNAENLRLLLDHGAFVGLSYYTYQDATETAIVYFLKNNHADFFASTATSDLDPDDRGSPVVPINTSISRETKVSICEMLLDHAAQQNSDDGNINDDDDDSNNDNDNGIAQFLQVSLEKLLIEDDGADDDDDDAPTETTESCCEILIEAGMSSRTVMFAGIKAGNLAICQWLVEEYNFDPFQEETVENDDSENEKNQQRAAVSPFLSAARKTDASLFEFFLNVWDERFASTGGKNSDGDCPIHVVCCDPLVSLAAITLLVNRHSDALAMVDGEQGLLPLHFAANWGTSLDVIFYLLRHGSDALRQRPGGNSATTAAAAAALPSTIAAQDSTGMHSLETGSRSRDGDDKQHDHTEACDGPVKKKGKMV